MGGTPPLKLRRHSDTDKPKGKRPCKTKHTSHREREKRKEVAASGPGPHPAADPAVAEDEKVSADGMSGMQASGVLESVSVCLLAPLIMQLGRGGRGGTEEGSMFTMFRGLLEL